MITHQELLKYKESLIESIQAHEAIKANAEQAWNSAADALTGLYSALELLNNLLHRSNALEAEAQKELTELQEKFSASVEEEPVCVGGECKE